MYLVISTTPHFCSILPVIRYYKSYTFGYVNIILLSTLFSILYHIYEESNYNITSIDYFFAGVWVIYDIYMGYTYANKNTMLQILLLNATTISINILIPYNAYYTLNHSVWHLINAYKCYYISTCISIQIANNIQYNLLQ